MAHIHQTSNGSGIADNILQISRPPPEIDRVGQDEAANDCTSAHPGERDALLGTKPLQTKLSQWWNKYTPICGIFTVIIFMLGSGADYCDGAAISIGFKDISDLYGQSEHAAWLVVAYQHTTMLVRPWYSVASKRYRWTGLLLTAYMLFAGGLLMSWLMVPPDIKEDSVKEFLLLALSRTFTAWGAAGVVLVPSLVFNGRSDPVTICLGLLFFNSRCAARSASDLGICTNNIRHTGLMDWQIHRRQRYRRWYSAETVSIMHCVFGRN